MNMRESRLVDLVVSDMAGTTVLDEGQVPRAFTAALAAHGLAVTAAQIEQLRGASKRDAIYALLPDTAGRMQLGERVYATFREGLARVFGAGVRSVPGAVEAIVRLRAAGVRVALNTGFDRGTTDLLLDALGWRTGVVDAVVCGDEVAAGRPAPDLIRACMQATGIVDPQRVASIGDTALDLQAGCNAGVALSIGVLSGAHSRERLEREPHTHIIASIADLPALLGIA